MNLRPRRSEEPEINVTSLIDVVLLLVVFFMLSSSFQTQGRLHVQLPRASSVPVQQRADALVVTVTAAGAYEVDGRELINASPDTLRTAILRTAGSLPRTTVVTLRADGRATQQTVVTAMDVLGQLGFTHMAIATVDQPTTQQSGAASP